MRQKIMLPFQHHTDVKKPARVLWAPGEVNFGSQVGIEPLKWSNLKTFQGLTTLHWGISGDRPYSVAVGILSILWHNLHTSQSKLLCCPAAGLPSGWVSNVTLHLCIRPQPPPPGVLSSLTCHCPVGIYLFTGTLMWLGQPRRRWQKLWAEPQGLLRYNPLGIDSYKPGA